jgi:REP element-mobilizing transposase RayT
MARPLRIEFPDATYHITSRGNERRDIFYCDSDREHFLMLLGQAARRFGWSITAWVLMSNHFHLVVQIQQRNLSKGMHWLNGTYAAWFNARHQRVGHLFQGRFKSILLERERYFANVLRYVVLNPVRAGIVARPEDYRWSSYRMTAGIDQPHDWIDLDAAFAAFGQSPDIAQVSYRQFVLEKIGSEDPLWNDLVNGIYLGGESWAKDMRRQVESKPRSTDHPKAHRSIGRPRMHAVVAAVAQAAGTTAERIRSRRGDPLRALIAWIGWNEGLQTLRSIAASLRMRSEGHVSNLIRRCELMCRSDHTLLDRLDHALATLAA